MTLLESARNNRITPLIKAVARLERVSPKYILEGIKSGKIVIPLNNTHKIKKPCAIGTGLKTKVNANLGTSTDKSQIQNEIKKLRAAVRAGADTVMDLSIGGPLKKIREQMIKISPVPVGTVPIYEMAVNAQENKGSFLDFDSDDILQVLESQAKSGVDFFTIHSGITNRAVNLIKKHGRILDIVSRGGAMIAGWMQRHKEENPFFTHFDKILDIAHEYDITLSLGDGLRPGSILDATDKAQIAELKTLSQLALKARNRGVQVMIEGPGHVPLPQIKKNIQLEKKICHGAPFYVLGPLVTDVAAGYDHISSAIGGAIAAAEGADFLCFVTPSEHLRHPSVEDTKEGVIASRIAAHAADIAKGIPYAINWDKAMSQARKKRNWKKQIELSIDPEKARKYRASSKPHLLDVCTMCGKYCSIKLMEECLPAGRQGLRA
ncbi:MAG: phosphomethylpyrimidine synthase ThiC [Candidatus Omnitrophica bacterium]|nr:phosphomethylpyrimidine synthase ThiC [Candidatus Omnitrophota bacterium]